MEEDGRDILSPLLTKPQIKKQLERLEGVVKEAQKRVDYTIAHDPEITKAINIVERFLRKTGRPCYGGQAINSFLPKTRKIYDPDYNIPDYDFFSASAKEDSEELIKDLEEAGFKDIYKKVGVHDGTTKIYANFVPIADISEIVPGLYKIIHGRAKNVEGIMYCDPDFLRMLMYLELSRPRGEVKRWSKVYERLLLINATFPTSKCSETIRTTTINLDDRSALLQFCIKHKCVVVSPEIIELFERNQSQKSLHSLVNRGGPVIFFSNTATSDAADIKAMLNKPKNGGIVTDANKIPMDNIFNFVTIKRRGVPIALIFQEDACHSYTTLKLDGGDTLRVATPDLFLHLYYSLMIFGKRESVYFETSLECLIQKIHEVLNRARDHPTEFLPSFGLRCSGRQRGIATLLRQKQERTDKEKQGLYRKSRKVKKSNRGVSSRRRRSNLFY